MIQRAGRLHRHIRTSRPVSGEPALVVRWPSGTPPVIDAGTLAIYSEHILLRTWAILRDRDSITVPVDVPQLIEYVYAETDVGPPQDVAEVLADRWRQTWMDLQDNRIGQLDQARDRRLLSPEGPTRLPSEFQRTCEEEDDLQLDGWLGGVTRLATPTVDVVLLRADEPLVEELRRGTARVPREMVRALLLRSVGISSQRFVGAMRHVPVPPRFAATPGLRHHRLLLLDAHDCAEINDLRLRLDPELGVLVESQPPQGTSRLAEVLDGSA
jgi:CRISPR-associated endonuclease/helicase Cas3